MNFQRTNLSIDQRHVFESLLDECKTLVYPEIETYFHTALDYCTELSNSSMEEFHWKCVTEYPNRKGKYVRPALLLLACEGAGGEKSAALKTAAAMQVSEDWLLVHDDLEDGATRRRGKLVHHLRYSPELAINAGDALQVIMWKILRDNEFTLGASKAFEIMDEFYRLLSRTLLGQTAEISWCQQQKFHLTYEEYAYVMDGKTSGYTVIGPMRLGARVAGLPERYLPIISEFGNCLGQCYQIVDDLLDVSSTFRGSKEPFMDIQESKSTIVLIHLLNHACAYDKQKVIEILQKERHTKTKAEVDLVVSLMDEYGSIEYTRQEAQRWGAQALDVLNQKMSFFDDVAREKLEWAIDFVVGRTF